MGLEAADGPQGAEPPHPGPQTLFPPANPCPSHSRAVVAGAQVSNSVDILLEELQLVNSPAFHVGLGGNLHATVRRMDIYVDRKVQRRLRAEAAARRSAVAVAGGPDDPPQDPAWLK